jgi:hypothetical protein
VNVAETTALVVLSVAVPSVPEIVTGPEASGA